MDSWKGKRVVVMGLGVHGGGAASARWFCEHGAKVTVTDLKTRSQLAASLRSLKGLPIRYALGRHDRRDFERADVVIQNPGVPARSPFILLARKNGAAIENEASIFFRYCPAPIIGVTGTRGKSTVASLTAELLKGAGRRVWLAGNIRITPMLAIVDRVRSTDRVVLELSSWHLELMSEYRQSPHIAVLTNISADHLNRYRSMREYVRAKAAILAFQGPQDFAVINRDNQRTRKLGEAAGAARFWFSEKSFVEENGCFVKAGWVVVRRDGKTTRVIPTSRLRLPGRHNVQNVLAAICVARALGVSTAKMRRVCSTFAGLPDRLEVVRQLAGVTYVNDTTATSPAGLQAALETLGTKQRRIILIGGGSDKRIARSEYAEVRRRINRHCKAIVLFTGTGSRSLLPVQVPKVQNVRTMADAIGLARSFARPGDTILLSPGCASFGLFENEFARGDQFRKLVREL